MDFNVDGQVKSIVARGFQEGMQLEDMPEQTEMIFAEELEGHKKDLLHKRYKITQAEYYQFSAIASMINENNAMHANLTPEQVEKYEDWEMVRCVNTLEIMTHKENEFLKELTGADA